MANNSVLQDSTDPLMFIATWLEPFATVPRKFLLTYYPNDHSVSLYEFDKKRMFLRRSPCPTLNISNLFVSNVVNIYSREIKIIGYGSEATKTMLESKLQCTFGLIHSGRFGKLGKVIASIYDAGLLIHRIKMFKAEQDDLTHFERWLIENSSKVIPELLETGTAIAMDIRGKDAVEKWALIAKTNFSDEAYASMNEYSAENELEILFSRARPIPCNTARFVNSTFCLLKPHIILAGKAGAIIDDILSNGYKITALEMFYLSLTQAQKFFEVYKGYLPSYDELISEMCSGPCIALEIVGSENIVKDFREFVGPHDSTLAKQTRPYTLRAKYGMNNILNAVHCTDLIQDTELEVEYFFRFLTQQ